MILAFIGFVLTFLGLIQIYQHAINSRMLEDARRESLNLAHLLGEEINEHSTILTDLKTLSPRSLQRTTEFALLDKLVRRYAKGLEVLQVNICNLKGVVIYSTDRNLLGQNNSSTSQFMAASAGDVPSEFTAVAHFYTLSGTTLDRETISTFVPVDWSGDGKTDVVVQVYVDATGRIVTAVNPLDRYQQLIAAILLGLFLLLMYSILRGRRLSMIRESEMFRQQQEVRRVSSQDRLTGLPNWLWFREQLESAMHRAREYEKLLAVVTLDLNRFKFINDKYGKAVGDEVLNSVAERLKKCAPDISLISRGQGGNFTFVLENILIADEVEETANHLLEIMSAPVYVEGQALYITFSLGVVLYPFDDDHVDGLIQKSEMALFQSKEAGRNTYRFYSSLIRDKSVSLFTLENALRQALERNEFKVYYQPVVQLGNGRIIGVEALLRWHSPDQGIIPPLEFISALEESGLIVDVGRWVLVTACKQVREWQLQGIAELKVNVNISAKQFRNENLLEYVDEALVDSGLKPEYLNLEITESLLLENRERVISMLDRLNEKGVSMSVDDFGTGYSSISYLKSMPIETIKVDKSFVRGIPHDMDDMAIINAIDYLSRNLRLYVIAEGVENEAQLAFLRRLNIFAIQGYLVSRPLPAPEMLRLLREHQPAQYLVG